MNLNVMAGNDATPLVAMASFSRVSPYAVFCFQQLPRFVWKNRCIATGADSRELTPIADIETNRIDELSVFKEQRRALPRPSPD
jgi:hypothetical protein